jgi:hypothetical protein
MRLTYGPKGKEVEVPFHDFTADETIEDLRKKVAKVCKLHWSRVELRGTDADNKNAKGEVQPAPIKFTGEKRTLKSFGAPPAMNPIIDVTAKVWVKDLGPQFSYRGVFLIEYGGPLALMLLYAQRPSFLGIGEGPLPLVEELTQSLPSGEDDEGWTSFVQCLCVAMYLLHFLKRELETCVCRCPASIFREQ